MSRAQMLSIALLALAAAVSGALLWLRPAPVLPDRFAGPSRPSYELIDFELTSYDSTGLLAFVARAPRLAHDERDGSLHLDTPVFELFGKDAPSWIARSQQARIDTEARRIDLERDVEIERLLPDQTEDFQLATDHLTARTEDRQLQTESEVVLSRPGSILRGIGFKADLNAQTWELLANVEATLHPKP